LFLVDRPDAFMASNISYPSPRSMNVSLVIILPKFNNLASSCTNPPSLGGGGNLLQTKGA